MSDRVRIGTRKSDLALWQAHHIRDALAQLHPGRPLEIVGMSTTGDDVQDIPLSAFSDKGVFTKELDVALLRGSIDLAVHSMKDLPTVLPEGLKIGAVPERGVVEDALVLSKLHQGKNWTLADLPAGSVVGTSSLRRRAMISRHFPDLVVADIRGNLNTRLRKLDDGQFDAIILATVGMQRLGWHDRISQVLPSDKFPHAVAQGALAVVCRSNDAATLELLQPLNHHRTVMCTTAERALLRTLEGGCKVPIAAVSKWEAGSLSLFGCVISPDGASLVESSMAGPATIAQQCDHIGQDLAAQLIQQGAKAILDSVQHDQMFHQAPKIDATPKKPTVQVGVIMGSDSDLECMSKAAEILDEFSVPFELTVVSAHRTPERMFEYAKAAHTRGLKVIIAGAGGAAHLPGMVAALTPLPVIGVPVKSSALSGNDSLLSIVQMPRGVPVATVAIHNATNAALLAVRIMAAFDPELQKKLIQYHADMEQAVLDKAAKLEQQGYSQYLSGMPEKKR